jgi:hypothetical protein
MEKKTEKIVKMKKLPNAVTIALGQYFLKYQLSQPQIGGRTTHPDGSVDTITHSGTPWDKNACLAEITESLPKDWTYQACAGSFWLMSARMTKIHYYITNSTWPLAEIRENKA